MADDIKVLEGKMQELKVLASMVRSNEDAISRFGTSFGGDRKLNDSLGWCAEPTYETYEQQYKRGGIASTLVNIRPEDTWRGDITVKAPDNHPNAKAFEAAFADAWEKLRLKEYFLRADKLAGIGQYAALRLGLKEPAGADQSKPLKRGSARELLYVSAYSQVNAPAKTLFSDAGDARFGMVETYQLTTSRSGSTPIAGATARQAAKTTSKPVHADRVVHIAENLLEDEVYGTPRLECVLNHLMDLQKVTGGSAEMYWQGAFPGMAFGLDPEAEIDVDMLESMEDQIDDMIMGLKRYLKLQGVTVQQLSPTVVAPDKQIDAQLDQIAGASRTPKRILIGNEAGELASSEDAASWNRVIQGRRETDANRWVRHYAEKLMYAGALPFVPSFKVCWPSLTSEKKKEASEIALNLARAIKEFVQGDGEQVLTLETFLSDVIGMDKQEAAEAAEAAGSGSDDDPEFEAAIDAAVARQLESLAKAKQDQEAGAADDNDNDGE